MGVVLGLLTESDAKLLESTLLVGKIVLSNR